MTFWSAGIPAFTFFMASELEKESWAVMSERGREAASLNYEDARRLVHRLAGEGRHGLCIVTNEAAEKLTGPAVPADTPGVPDRV